MQRSVVSRQLSANSYKLQAVSKQTGVTSGELLVASLVLTTQPLVTGY